MIVEPQLNRGRSLTRLTRAIRIYKAVIPALSQRRLFNVRHDAHGTLWLSKHFHIASVATPAFRSFEVWPVPDETGLLEYPNCSDKAMNLHRLADGSFYLVSFKGGGWEEMLLRYVGAPLGLLTLKAC